MHHMFFSFSNSDVWLSCYFAQGVIAAKAAWELMSSAWELSQLTLLGS